MLASPDSNAVRNVERGVLVGRMLVEIHVAVRALRARSLAVPW